MGRVALPRVGLRRAGLQVQVVPLRLGELRQPAECHQQGAPVPVELWEPVEISELVGSVRAVLSAPVGAAIPKSARRR